MSSLPDNLKPVLADLVLAIADDKLMLGHRNSDWTGLGPILEEDIAFSSLAQDEIAHASAFYELAEDLLGTSADDLAFGRPPEEYRSCALVEVPDEFDWATAIARQFFCDHFDLLRLQRMAKSAHAPLAKLAARIAAEEQVHVEHSNSWVIRLGQGTDESKKRMQEALDHLGPLGPTLFEPVEGQAELVDHDYYPDGDEAMFKSWSSRLNEIVEKAGLVLRMPPHSPDVNGGRRGVHTEHLAPLLDEMCEVYRLEPGAAW